MIHKLTHFLWICSMFLRFRQVRLHRVIDTAEFHIKHTEFYMTPRSQSSCLSWPLVAFKGIVSLSILELQKYRFKQLILFFTQWCQWQSGVNNSNFLYESQIIVNQNPWWVSGAQKIVGVKISWHFPFKLGTVRYSYMTWQGSNFGYFL